MPGGPAGGNRAGGAAPSGGVTSEEVDTAIAAAFATADLITQQDVDDAIDAAIAAAGLVPALSADVVGAAAVNLTCSGILGNTTHKRLFALIDIIGTAANDPAVNRILFKVNNTAGNFVQIYRNLSDATNVVQSNSGTGNSILSAFAASSRMRVSFWMHAAVVGTRHRVGRLACDVLDAGGASTARYTDRTFIFPNGTDEITSISLQSTLNDQVTPTVALLDVGTSIRVYAL